MSTALQLTSAEQALGISLPSRRMEDWRWTDLRARITKPYAPAKVSSSAADIDRLVASSPFARIVKAKVVFVNGVLDTTRSKFTGLDVKVNPPDIQERGEIVAMNRAMNAQGCKIGFHDSAETLTEIIHVTTEAAPRAVALRNHIIVADGASASIIETFVGDGDYLMTCVTEFTIGKDAHLERLKLQKESSAATHLSQTIYNLSTNSRLNDVSVQLGSTLTRQNGTCNFNGENAEAKISGAYLLKGKQHADTCLTVNHLVPHCTSRELFKCVMDDNARGIFQGKVVVAKHAQKTDGKQSSHALLLSESAEFDAKPELEIFADDVVCGHGATAGDLNHDHLFYLESRGIPKDEAKALLIAAFVGEAFDLVANDECREALAGIAQEWVTGK